MQRQERIEHLSETFINVLSNWQKELWTAMPGIIQSFNPVQKTAVVQVAINLATKSLESDNSLT